jgi:hypothetical protein
VSSHLWLPLLLGALVLPYSVLTRRAAAKIRQGDQDWVAQWGALDPEQRRELNRTMRAGKPVRDPEYAELSLRGVTQQRFVRDAMEPLRWLGLFGLTAMLVGGLITSDIVALALGGFGLVGLGASWVLGSRQHRNLGRSAEETRRLHGL